MSLSANRITQELEQLLERSPGRHVLESVRGKIAVYDTIDSTNSECKRLTAGKTPDALKKLHGTTVIADSQTAGRGRLGRNFFSPAAHGIYMSMVYVPEQPLTDPAFITASVAVAVCRALDDVYKTDCQTADIPNAANAADTLHTANLKNSTQSAPPGAANRDCGGNSPFRIKWVNDIFCGGKKICGILTEGVISAQTKSIAAAIIGIGINISEPEESFPEQIAAVAGSIKSQTNRNIDRTALAAAVIARTFAILQDHSGRVMDEYLARSLVVGKKVTVLAPAGSYQAQAVGITDTAHLLVEREPENPGQPGETVELYSGEISIRLA